MHPWFCRKMHLANGILTLSKKIKKEYIVFRKKHRMIVHLSDRWPSLTCCRRYVITLVWELFGTVDVGGLLVPCDSHSTGRSLADYRVRPQTVQ